MAIATALSKKLSRPAEKVKIPESDLRFGAEKDFVLIADDDRDVLRLWEVTLKNAGFNVLTAHDGENALYLANEFVPDVTLLEFMLRKLNGIELLRRLRGNKKTVDMKIIIVTDLPIRHGDFETELADAMIWKPVEPEHVLAAVRSLLE